LKETENLQESALLSLFISIYLGGKKKKLATMIYDGNLRHTICGAVAPPKFLETHRVRDG